MGAMLVGTAVVATAVTVDTVWAGIAVAFAGAALGVVGAIVLTLILVAAAATTADSEAEPTAEEAPEQAQPKGGTYQLVDPDTSEVVRNGRTKDLKGRQRQHAKADETKGLNFEEKSRTDEYEEQRGLEQIQLDTKKGKMDKIRGIAQNNPNLAGYIAAGQAYLELKGWIR